MWIMMHLFTNPLKASSMAPWNVATMFIIPKGIHLYVNIPHFVVNVIFNLSSSSTITYLYLEYPSRNDIILNPFTIFSTFSSEGSGQLSFWDAWFKFLKSTQRWISPLFFLTGTELETQVECYVGKMILASYNFWNFIINGSMMGFTGLLLWLKGFKLDFKGILCIMALGSYFLSSS